MNRSENEKQLVRPNRFRLLKLAALSVCGAVLLGGCAGGYYSGGSYGAAYYAPDYAPYYGDYGYAGGPYYGYDPGYYGGFVIGSSHYHRSYGYHHYHGDFHRSRAAVRRAPSGRSATHVGHAGGRHH